MRRGAQKISMLDRREAVALQDLEREIKAARQRVAILVHGAARDRGIVVSGRNREALYDRIGQVYLQLDNGLKDWGKDLARKTAIDWRDEAIRDVKGQTGIDPSNDITKFSRKYAEDVWKLVAPENGRSLAAVFTDKMAEQDIKQLRTTAVETFRGAALSGSTQREIARELQGKWDSAAGDMAAFRFVDNAGRQWQNARYLQMLVRTTTARVSRDSYFQTLTAAGDDLAQIENVDGEACDICQAWDGVIVSITGQTDGYPTYQQALGAGWGHPNCRCMAERVDETLDGEEIQKQADEPTPDLDQTADETDAEYRKRVAAAVAEYSRNFEVSRPDPDGVRAKNDLRISGAEFGGNDVANKVMLKRAVEWARARLAKSSTIYNGNLGGEVHVSMRGVKHALYSYPTRLQTQLTAAIPDIIRVAKVVSKEADTASRKDILAVYKLRASVRVGNQTVPVGIVVRETNMGLRYYDHYPLEKK